MRVPEQWRAGAKRRAPRGSIDPTMAGKEVGGTMLTPEQIAGAGTEHAHQAALFQWVNTIWKHPKRHMLFAVPNGGDRQAHVGASMRAEGVKPGVPDLCWPIQAGLFPGLYLELKVPGRERTKNGGLSDAQVKWLADLRQEGYCVAVAYGWQSAAWVLALYAEGRSEPGDEASLAPVDGARLHLFATPSEEPPTEPWLKWADLWYGGD